MIYLSVNLSDQIDYYRYLTREQEINALKQSNSILYEARRKAKIDKCLICGRTMDSFCNSHTVPQFSLRKISTDGIVLNINSLLESPAMKNDAGLNQAGVFHVVCHDCDHKVFREYENPNNYKEGNLSSKMMAEIALKNYLKLLDKKLFERVLHQQLIQRFPNHHSAMQHRLDVIEFDYNNYKVGYEKAKRLSQKDDNDGYYLIYYKLLNYTAPMAFQAAITLAVDFEGEIVNAIYNMNSHYKMKELHLAVLPMNGKTAIVMFIDNGEKRYKSFNRQFNKLSECDKLGAINYLIFLYSEDYFFSKTIKEKIDTDCLRRIAGIMPQYYTFETKEPCELLSGDFRLDKWNSIPNLLDRTYAIE